MNSFNEDLVEILSWSPVATAVYTGTQLQLVYANHEMLAVLNRTKDIMGYTADKIFKEHPSILGVLTDTGLSGRPQKRNEVRVGTFRKGLYETRFYDFSYVPLLRTNGSIAVIQSAIDVSLRVSGKNTVERERKLLQIANLEFACSHQELLARCEHLSALNLRLRHITALD